MKVLHANHDDVRGHLVLAHAFMDLEWYTDAIERYAPAYEVDPKARFDRRMLRDLLTIVTNTQNLHERAEAAVARIFGKDAVVEIEHALDGEKRAVARERLTELRARIVNGPRPEPAASEDAGRPSEGPGE